MGLGTMFKKFLMARQVEMEKGRFAVSGVRQTGASVSTLISIQEEVIREMGNKGVKILYTAGKIGGKELVNRLMKVMGISRTKMVDVLATGCTEMMGWGIISVIKCDFQEHYASFKVEDSPLSMKREKKAFCHLERGLIAGAMGEIFSRRVDGIEIRCKSLGHHFCQFEVKPTEDFDPNDKLVREQLPVEDIIKAKKK